MLPDWVWDRDKRAVVGFVAAGVTAVIAALWALFVFVSSRPTVLVTPAVPVERTSPEQVPGMPGWVVSRKFIVCKAETKDHCLPNSVFIGCTDLRKFEENACGSFTAAPLFKIDGKECGAESVELSCIIRGQ